MGAGLMSLAGIGAAAESVSHDSAQMADMVVVATRDKQELADVPARVTVITAEEIERMPGLKIDRIIERVSGVNTTRTSISDMRPVVGMRGLGAFEQGRVLVLVDGVPVNKTDNGDVNWNRLETASVERIEIMMGGVINIITRGPAPTPSGRVTAEMGTHDTYGGRLSLSGWLTDEPYGPYMTLSGHYRETDGHEAMSPYSRSLLSRPAEDVVSLWLDEWSVSPTFGYQFDDLTRLELSYSHYFDKRSEGRRGDDEPDGEHRHFTTDAARIHLQSGWDEVRWHADLYYQLEQYYKYYDRPAPRVNTDVDSDRQDFGAILHASAPLFVETNRLAGGVEIRRGIVDAADIDDAGGGFIENSGKMTLYGIYLQDTLDAMDNRLHLSFGLRADFARYTDGDMETDPNNLFAGYINSTGISDENWSALSPSAGVRYDFTDRFSAYASYARGFRAPELDDLCRTGWQYVGPKIANPDLDRETIDTFELGFDWQATERLTLNASAFYSIGHDFLYYVDTGIPVAGGGYWATQNYQIKQNVGNVHIYGAELDLRYNLNRHVDLYANYAYADSEIMDYEKPDFPGAVNLEGRMLRDAPRHIVNAGADILTPLVNLNVNARWKDAYYTDDINSDAYETDSFVMLDIRLWQDIGERVRVALDITNVLDEEHTDTPSGRINGKRLASSNPGRLFIASVTLSF
jgi:iron complex outermembrane receptor protein